MAEPFQPRFVDLVRNTTTTQGTGNIVLGSAVTGFTSFASAIQPGESFYYCVAGVDKPAEREVGRGTMQADGTISRDPINGVLTNFTSGTKNVSLIAAAEWFTQVHTATAGGGDAALLSITRGNYVPLVNGSGADIVQDGDTSILTVPDSNTTDWWASAGPLEGDFVVELEIVESKDNWPLFWFATTSADSAAEPSGHRFVYAYDADFDPGRGKLVAFGHKPGGFDDTLQNLEGKLFIIRKGVELQYWSGVTLETAFMSFREPDPVGGATVYFNVNSAWTWTDLTGGVWRIAAYDITAKSALSTELHSLMESAGKQLTNRPYSVYPQFKARFYLNSIYNFMTGPGSGPDNTWVRIQNNPPDPWTSQNWQPYQIRFHHNGNEWRAGIVNAATNRVQVGLVSGSWDGFEMVGPQFAHMSGNDELFRSDANGLTSKGRLRLQSYTNTSPADGDIWFEGTKLKKREGGVTTDLDTGGGGGLSDGDYGDVLVGGSGTTMTVESAAGNFTATGNISGGGTATFGNRVYAKETFRVVGSYGWPTADGEDMGLELSSNPPGGQAFISAYNRLTNVRGDLWMIGSVVDLRPNNVSALLATTLGVSATGTLSATGAVSGSNLSGTNTGDQFTSMTASRLLGRGDSGSGPAQEISIGSGLSLSGTTLSAIGGPNVTAFDSGAGPTLDTTEVTIGTVSLNSVPAGTPVLIMARANLLKDSGSTARTSTIRVRRGTTNSDTQVGADCGLHSQGVATSDYGPGVVIAVDTAHGGGNLTYTVRGVTSAASGSTVPNFELAAIPLTLAA